MEDIALIRGISNSFQKGDHDHIETSPLICITNESTVLVSFYMIGTSVMKEFNPTKHLSWMCVYTYTYIYIYIYIYI